MRITWVIIAIRSPGTALVRRKQHLLSRAPQCAATNQNWSQLVRKPRLSQQHAWPGGPHQGRGIKVGRRDLPRDGWRRRMRFALLLDDSEVPGLCT